MVKQSPGSITSGSSFAAKAKVPVCQPFRFSPRKLALTRMVYPRPSVELTPDPMPGEHRTDRKVPPAQELVNRPPYLAELAPWPARRDARL